MKQFSDFIFVKDDTLSSEFCEHVIQKFEDEGQSEPGGIGRFNTFNPTVKQSYDLFISPDNGWGDEDSVFFESLTACYEEYHKKCIAPVPGILGFETLWDKGYRIQRTIPGGFYHWHHDFGVGGRSNGDLGERLITFIWYLNDVDEGGYTEFMDGTKVQPKQGRICFFPCTWNYAHRGVPPVSGNKYICTGWLHSKVEKQKEDLNS